MLVAGAWQTAMTERINPAELLFESSPLRNFLPGVCSFKRDRSKNNGEYNIASDFKKQG